MLPKDGGIVVVALLAEGVDRNDSRGGGVTGLVGVALLAEGVDRNPEEEQEETEVTSRPPRGGRG